MVEPPDPVHLRHICAASAQPLRSVDTILAEAKAEGIPERIEPRAGCCGGGVP
jgi:hypothetical protein